MINKLNKWDLNCSVFNSYDFDDCMSLNELLCRFFTKINECVDTTNNTLEIVKWMVNEGLHIEVIKKLEQWLNDGTLSDLINEKLLGDIINMVNPLFNNLLIIENVDDFYNIEPNKTYYVKDGRYTIEKPIILDKNNLIGLGEVIINKNFPVEIGYSKIYIKNNSYVFNISFNGSDTTETIYQSDILIHGDNSLVERCVFDKSEGSSITFSNGATNSQCIYCSFGEYRDHSVYISSDTGNTENIKIEGCNFNSSNNRDAIKIRNGVKNVLINSCSGTVGGIFINIETFGSDTCNYIKKVNNITIRSNNVKSTNFINFGGIKEIDDIEVYDNNTICTDYMIRCGLYPTDEEQRGIIINNLYIKDNKDVSKGIILNGDISEGINNVHISSCDFQTNESSYINIIGRVINSRIHDSIFEINSGSILYYPTGGKYDKYKINEGNLLFCNNEVRSDSFILADYSSKVNALNNNVIIENNIVNKVDNVIYLSNISYNTKVIINNNNNYDGLLLLSNGGNFKSNNCKLMKKIKSLNESVDPQTTKYINITDNDIKIGDSVSVNIKYDIDRFLIIGVPVINEGSIKIPIFNTHPSTQIQVTSDIIITIVRAYN